MADRFGLSFFLLTFYFFLMKYCPRCKLKAKEHETACSRCGGELRVLGGPPPTSKPPVAAPIPPVPTSKPPVPTSKPPVATSKPPTAAPKPPVATSKPPTAAPIPPVDGPAAQPAPAAGGEPSQQKQLRLELAGLQRQVAKSAAGVRRLAIVAGVLTVLLVFVLLLVRHNYVMGFAALEGVDIVPLKSRPGAARISYRPRSTGKVEFVRETPQRRETLIEYATDRDTTGDKKEFDWSGPKADRYTLHVRYRRGWGLVTKDFQSSNPRSRLIDTQ